MPDMNIKVAAFTVSEKSIDTHCNTKQRPTTKPKFYPKIYMEDLTWLLMFYLLFIKQVEQKR